MLFPVLKSSRVHPMQSKWGCVCQWLATSGQGWSGVTGPTHCFYLEFSKQKICLRHSYSCLHKFYVTRYPWFEIEKMSCLMGKEAFPRKEAFNKAWVQTKERNRSQHRGHTTPTAVTIGAAVSQQTCFYWSNTKPGLSADPRLFWWQELPLKEKSILALRQKTFLLSWMP